MESIYCGGRFYFDYQQEGYREKAAKDYRALLLDDVNLLLRGTGRVKLSDRLSYIGPYYFETDGMVDREIVEKEKGQIEECTYAFFLLDDGLCPGTIGEIIYAAALKKRICIFYVADENETESTLLSSCWYPIILCQMINGESTDVISCANLAEAAEKLLDRVKELI